MNKNSNAICTKINAHLYSNKTSNYMHQPLAVWPSNLTVDALISAHRYRLAAETNSITAPLFMKFHGRPIVEIIAPIPHAYYTISVRRAPCNRC
jgi:hypothetical protein